MSPMCFIAIKLKLEKIPLRKLAISLQDCVPKNLANIFSPETEDENDPALRTEMKKI